MLLVREASGPAQGVLEMTCLHAPHQKVDNPVREEVVGKKEIIEKLGMVTLFLRYYHPYRGVPWRLIAD